MKLPGRPSTGDSSNCVMADDGSPGVGGAKLEVCRLSRRWSDESCRAGAGACCVSKLLASGKYSCSPWGPVLLERDAGEGCSGCLSLELRNRGDVGGGGAVTTAGTLGPGLAPKGDFPRS